MSKVKTTAKSIRNAYPNIITIGYCDLQYLLGYFSPAYYTCGVYGWNCDVYIIDSETVIATGYRPVNGNYINYELVKKYNDKAKAEIYGDNIWKIDYQEQKRRADKLLADFVKEIKQS